MGKIKIILADNHRIFVEGISSLLKEDDEVELLDFAYDGYDLMNLLTILHPDVILLDINMPRLSGLEAAVEIRKKYPAIKIILLTNYNVEPLIKKARQIGIDAYLLKDCTRAELKQTIRSVLNNGKIFPDIEELGAKDKFIEEGFLKKINLTSREIEILLLIKKGDTNEDIAKNLFLSINTVKTHRKNIMQKLGVSNLAGLLRFIAENGI